MNVEGDPTAGAYLRSLHQSLCTHSSRVRSDPRSTFTLVFLLSFNNGSLSSLDDMGGGRIRWKVGIPSSPILSARSIESGFH